MLILWTVCLVQWLGGGPGLPDPLPGLGPGLHVVVLAALLHSGEFPSFPTQPLTLTAHCLPLLYPLHQLQPIF